MTVYISRDPNSAYLAHYGVMGMKWGIRKDGMPQGWQGGKLKKAVGDKVNSAKEAGSDFYHKHEKAIKIGAAAVAVAAASYAAYKGYQMDAAVNGEFNIVDGNLPQTLLTRCKNVITVAEHGDILKQKAASTSAEFDQSQVNPYYKQAIDNYNSGKPGSFDLQDYKSLTNCASCSAMYDLRRRGFDVSANRTQNFNRMDANLNDLYPGAKLSKYQGLDQLNKELGDMPTGARGTLAGLTTGRTGHSIAWEKTSTGVVYRDCQSNETYTPATINKLYADIGNETRDTFHNGGVAYARLDNVTPDLSKMYKTGIISKPGTNLSDYDKASNIIRDTRGYTDLNLPAGQSTINKLLIKAFKSNYQSSHLKETLDYSRK